MQILDNLIILLLIVGAFLGGLVLAGFYWRKIVNELRYTCKILASQNGLGYIAPPEATTEGPITQSFMDHLRKNGRATTAIRSQT